MRQQKLTSVMTSDNVRLAIEDNGRGFKPDPETMTGFGLRGMRERVMAVVCSFENRTRAGCQIVELPLHLSKEGSRKTSEENTSLVNINCNGATMLMAY